MPFDITSRAARAETETRATGEFRTFVAPGDIDSLGDEVERVYIRTEKYQIYRARHQHGDIAPTMLRHMIDADHHEAAAMNARLTPILQDGFGVCDVMSSIRPMRIFGTRSHDELREQVYKTIARAMAYCFDGEGEAAAQMLAELRAEVARRRDSVNRMRYVSVNVLSLLVCVLLVAVAGRLGVEELFAFQIAETPIMAEMLFFGALGAFFSVAVTLNRLKVDHAISLSEMAFAGAVRIPIGLIAAGAVMLLIGGGWLFDGGLGEMNTLYNAYLLAFAAGFSETFVPNTLTKVAEARGAAPQPARA